MPRVKTGPSQEASDFSREGEERDDALDFIL